MPAGSGPGERKCANYVIKRELPDRKRATGSKQEAAIARLGASLLSLPLPEFVEDTHQLCLFKFADYLIVIVFGN